MSNLFNFIKTFTKKTFFFTGWEELYKQFIEKNWSERLKEWKEKGK